MRTARDARLEARRRLGFVGGHLFLGLERLAQMPDLHGAAAGPVAARRVRLADLVDAPSLEEHVRVVAAQVALLVVGPLAVAAQEGRRLGGRPGAALALEHHAKRIMAS